MTYKLPKQEFNATPFISTGQAVASNQSAVSVPPIAFNQSAFTETINLPSAPILFFPIFIDESRTFTKLGVHVTNTPGAGSEIMMALYDQGGSGLLPGNVLASGINLDSSAAGMIEATISLPLNQGWYWMAIQPNTTATVTVRSFGNNGPTSLVTNKLFMNPSNLSSTDFQGLYTFSVSNTYGTFPTNPTPSANNSINGVPLMYLR